MCGICGLITRKELLTQTLERMNDTMTHRGPDDAGTVILDRGGVRVGLAQRRLSIQDLSALGHQPMRSADGTVWLVFNGEIYNFKELRGKTPDYPFRSECDTEVILAMYQKFGIECLSQFNGMFAFALYDTRTDCLYLARDRMGQKPLYYGWEGETFLFGSELKPILAWDGFSDGLNRSVLKSYLFHGYITGPDSIFEHISKLEPGMYLECRGGVCSKHYYWDLTRRFRSLSAEPVEDYAAAKQMLRAGLKKAVAYRMIADVPVGAFLSGGYDSSLITALAQESSDKPVRTYSIGFADKSYDEAPFARAVARHLGTDHVEYYITEPDIFKMLDRLTYYYDEPFADSSQIPTMLVSELASRDLKVVLSGDGGDELFCGYQHYATVGKLQRLRLPIRAAGAVLGSPLLRGTPAFRRLPDVIRGMIQEGQTPFQVQPFGCEKRLLCDKLLREGDPPFLKREAELQWIGDWQQRKMVLEMLTYLPDDILCKVDRASMKYSLEARAPLLDKDVVELSFRLSHRFKYQKGKGKYILKDIAYDLIPRELLDRPKQGFSVPLRRWLQGPLREELLTYTQQSYIRQQGVFEYEPLARLVETFLRDEPGRSKSHAGLIWRIYVLQKWYEQYVRAR